MSSSIPIRLGHGHGGPVWSRNAVTAAVAFFVAMAGVPSAVHATGPKATGTAKNQRRSPNEGADPAASPGGNRRGAEQGLGRQKVSLTSPIRYLKTWRGHNKRVDRDERLKLREFHRFAKTGELPERVEPTNVLARKLERTEGKLDKLKRDADATRYMSWGFGGSVRQFKNTFFHLNELTQELAEAERYASDKDLDVDRSELKQRARKAVRAMEWHIDYRFTIGGIQGARDFRSAYRDAKRNYRKLEQYSGSDTLRLNDLL